MDKNKELRIEKDEPIDEALKHRYLSIVGSLNYLATISGPDIAYAVLVLGRFNNNPRQCHVDAAVRVYVYLKGTISLGLSYVTLDKELKPVGYIDADWGGCTDIGRLTTGWVYVLVGSSISWAL